MLYTPLLPEAASGTLEPRHVVVPLRRMCPHSELLLGTATALDDARRARHGRDARWRLRDLVRAARGRRGRGDPRAARTRAGRARPRLQGRRRRDRAPQPGAPAAGVRGRPARRGGASPRSRLRLRRSRVRGRGGAGGAERPRSGRGAPDPRARHANASAGCSSTRRRRSCRRSRARLGRYTHAELERRGVEIHVGTTLESFTRRARRCSRTESASRRGHSSGQPACGPTPSSSSSGFRSTSAAASWSTPHWPWRAARASGRSATAPRYRTPPRPAGSTRPPASTPSARHAVSRRTSRGAPQPYRYRMLGQVATLGRYKGIADVCGIRLRGFPGWFVTRSYHLYALPMLRRKIARDGRLDGVAPLPPRRRRALGARPPAPARPLTPRRGPASRQPRPRVESTGTDLATDP